MLAFPANRETCSFYGLMSASSELVCYDLLYCVQFLSGLLCHRRLAAKFVLNSEGLRGLVSVVRPSVAATAVSMCLFYIACCRDVFERALPQLNPNLLRFKS